MKESTRFGPAARAVLMLVLLWALASCAGANEATAPVEAAPANVPAAAEPTPCTDETARCAIDLSGNALVPADAPSSEALPEQGGALKVETAPVVVGHGRSPAAGTRIPRETGRLTLVSDEVTIRDLRLDESTMRAYVSDSERVVHVVDMETMAEVAAIPTSGDRLVLDVDNKRLYVAPDWTLSSEEESLVTVIDIATNGVVGTLPGENVAVTGHGDQYRLYVGDYVGFFEEDAPGVRLYDGATLELITQGELAGEPVVNPATGELIIVNYSAFTVDPFTLEVREDLFPEISSTEIRGCNGCPAVRAAWSFPFQSYLAVDVQTISAGKGAGNYPPPLLYWAETMERVTSPALEVVPTCGSEPRLNEMVEGYRLAHRFYSRYLVQNNLDVLDADGAIVLSKDGLGAPFVNTRMAVAYVQDRDATTWVLDHATLDPLATLPPLCFFTQANSGFLLATDPARHDLIKLDESGGVSISPTADDAATLGPDRAIYAIIPSPSYAQDATIFLVTSALEGGQSILRSTDGGENWTLLGGLPGGADLQLEVAISPNFDTDKTLFAGGLRGDYAGIGVWVSTDSGDTWSPRWHGLEHLRITGLDVSPRFGEDQTLIAQSRFDRITPYDDGYSIHRSTDAGLNWTRVITAEYEDLLPAASVYLPITGAKALSIRQAEWYGPLEVQLASGKWTTATVSLGDEATVVAIAAATGDESGKVYYVAARQALLRTTDGGLTWQRWSDEPLHERDYLSGITAFAILPIAGDVPYRLLVGTGDGEFWSLDPATMGWEDAAAPAAEGIEASAPEPVVEVPTLTPAQSPLQTPTTVPMTGTEGVPDTAGTPLPDTPPAGLFVPEGGFADQWKNSAAVQQDLGFALFKSEESTPAAVQSFENGQMVWLGKTQEILVVLYDGEWRSFADTFKEGEPERDPSLVTPGELLQPERGFGKVWRANPDVQEAIGWATQKEQGVTATVQEYERGRMVRVSGQVLILILMGESGGAWRQ